MSIPDLEFNEIERLGNCSIHEIVFALQHAEDDNAEDAAQAIMTAQGNLDRMAEIVAKHDPSSK